MPIRKAVMPIAGLGTRVLPASKSVPKEMLPLADRPTIQYIVEEAVASGASQIVMVISRSKNAIADYFDDAPELSEVLTRKGDLDRLRELERIEHLAPIAFVRQHEPKGLGHAVLMAREVVGDEPFGVLLGDDLVDHPGDPCLKQLIGVHERYGGSVLAVMRVPRDEVSRYGVVALEPGGSMDERTHRVRDLVEKPPADSAPSNLIIIGRYVLTPGIFPILAETPPSAGGEIQLTDAIHTLARREPVWAYEFEGTRYDTGDPIGLLTTSIAFALKRRDLAPRLRTYLRTLRLDE